MLSTAPDGSAYAAGMSVFGKLMALPLPSTSFAVGRYSVLRCAASSTTMLVKAGDLVDL